VHPKRRRRYTLFLFVEKVPSFLKKCRNLSRDRNFLKKLTLIFNTDIKCYFFKLNIREIIFRYTAEVISVVRPLIFTTIMTTAIGVVFGSLNMVTVSIRIKKIISFNVNRYVDGWIRCKNEY